MHFPLSLSFRIFIKGGKGEGERGWKKLLCKFLIWKYYKHSGRRLLLRRRVEPLKKSRVFNFHSNFHYSLPYHTLEVRITALVQILHQQLGARRRAARTSGHVLSFQFLSSFFPGVMPSPVIRNHGADDLTNWKDTPRIPSWVRNSRKERTSKTTCPK